MSSLTSPIAAQHPSPDPCPEEVRALEVRLAEYLAPELVLKVRRAYEVGAAAHAGQLRKSGEPYITHPLAVAGILADLRMDAETLCAAILHDALEDTPLSINFTAAMISVMVSAAIGVIFGFFPARRAARLDPIEALRRE